MDSGTDGRDTIIDYVDSTSRDVYCYYVFVWASTRKQVKMVRLGDMSAHPAALAVHDLRSPGLLVLLAFVATVAVTALAAFGCAEGAKKPRRNNNDVYYYGQGYPPPPPPVGVYGYPAQPSYAYLPPPPNGGKQGRRRRARARLAWPRASSSVQLSAAAGVVAGAAVAAAVDEYVVVGRKCVGLWRIVGI
ncbi:hypothetical protein BRADI_5g24507v3 [Brachypodium distachyon]|uniref:Uncharacterized protein n=2 Tax=Brachypodium distachyon TaxID=15368 RepID=A0A2K2CJ27_BRADI|nr:hypothetical protein BRADI_5g24507v3 [Brachypodium distachyon]